MPCYAINPILLYTSACSRKVCIHCRVDFRLPVLIEDRTTASVEILRNARSVADADESYGGMAPNMLQEMGV